MAGEKPGNAAAPLRESTIRRLVVRRFKSHFDESAIELRPLTVLAGANSSGKSSIMQPLLLLKQTFDATFDPGGLKLDGPNVQFSDPAQFLAKRKGRDGADSFEIEVTLDPDWTIRPRFELRERGLAVASTSYANTRAGRTVELLEERPIASGDRAFFNLNLPEQQWAAVAIRRSALIVPAFQGPGEGELMHVMFGPPESLSRALRRAIHLPGYRGDPDRVRGRTAIGPSNPGLFHEYAASIVLDWTEKRDPKLDALADALYQARLGWKIDARARDAVSIEVRVSRTREALQGGAKDLVSIADVGFGVSQTLPVLVALIAAEPGQLIYIEQPEIHLHPAAQKGLADLIAKSAAAGARIVVETHSEIILTRLQWNVANGLIPKSDVVAHWFTRDKDGMSQVTSAEPDETGAFGEWPADFADVAAQVDQDYIDAAQQRLFERTRTP
ncbi:MAG: AAA family ATPase [Deltaproteobacteria bacterium]|nr:AAA family ATPase [Deltaproteobacteria bacterium]